MKNRRPCLLTLALWTDLEAWVPRFPVDVQGLPVLRWTDSVEKTARNYAGYWGKKFGRHGDDLDDYVAACLMKCYEKVVKGKVKHQSGLYLVCRNFGIGEKRKSDRRPTTFIDDVPNLDPEAPATDLDALPLVEQIRAFCPFLVEYAEAVESGETNAAIAEGLGVSVKDLREMVASAQAKVRSRFGVLRE